MPGETSDAPHYGCLHGGMGAKQLPCFVCAACAAAKAGSFAGGADAPKGLLLKARLGQRGLLYISKPLPLSRRASAASHEDLHHLINQVCLCEEPPCVMVAVLK